MLLGERAALGMSATMPNSASKRDGKEQHDAGDEKLNIELRMWLATTKPSLDRVSNGTAFPLATSDRETAPRLWEQASKHGFPTRQLPGLE
ncbi:MAG: hypothetical protein ACI89X_002305 [Planctomycetota bacterium]|jgi:hypothetical protein